MPDSVRWIEPDACCGCGVCAALAPCRRLEMTLSPHGFYVPTFDRCSGCGACETVCPGCAGATADVEAPLGDFLATFVGHSAHDDERAQASSGGLATRVLKALLDRGEIDAAVVVRSRDAGAPLFEAAIARTPGEIQSATGSKYYPVEFSKPLRELQESGERFALVGIPCAITGVRLGMERYRWLQGQCRALLGLTCGHLVSTHYTGFLASVSGVAPSDLREVDYRHGAGAAGAGDYTFVATRTDGTTGDEIPFATEGGIPAAVWGGRLLTPGACFRCTDLFAVDADLTLMDAWLPEYREQAAGTSLAVVRSEQMLGLLEDERDAGRLHLASIDAERVIESQAGGLRHRRQGTALRQAERGDRSLPLSRRMMLGWEQLRSRLSTRMFAGGPRLRGLGVGVIRAWVGYNRAGRRLRSIASRLMKLCKPGRSRRGES
ncbi:MAG: Coenzyme F420 hydrogenase/dehydrogenase, beta subunit C-terminal domain [Armatimonadota bacterium]